LAKLTEIACEAAGVRRVSLWTRTEGGQVLICDDCYDRESDGHTQGERVAASATAETLEDVESPVAMECSAAPVAGSSVAPRQAMRSIAIAPDRAMVFMARLAARGLDQEDMGVQVFADSTVLVVQLTDPLALAERPYAESARSMADHLVCTLEDLAAANGIEYLKIMSDESESTYQRMRDRFLFSVRGAYYVQEVGELSTYILTGRI
jgi:hypothetical protein